MIGIPDSRMGEEVCACIRLNEGASITSEKIKEYCKGKVSSGPVSGLTKIIGRVKGYSQKLPLINSAAYPC